MPELPEVETIRQDLQKKIVNKKITQIVINKEKIVHNNSKEFVSRLKNQSIKNIERIGKLIIFKFHKTSFSLLIHLKMTGQLIYKQNQEITAGGHNYPALSKKLPNKHTHVIFKFADKSKLFFNDLRQFGYLKITDAEETKSTISKYGIEPLTKNFTLANFSQIIKNKKTKIKNFLLDQKNIAGIGNIYADEICFDAGVLPDRTLNSLKKSEIIKLFSGCQKIIKKAIKHRGTTFSDYRDTNGKKGNFLQFLQVYGRGQQLCLKCNKNTIIKKKIAGRGTHYCANCQK